MITAIKRFITALAIVATFALVLSYEASLQTYPHRIHHKPAEHFAAL